MLFKKCSKNVNADNKSFDMPPAAEKVSDGEARELILRWLSAFAPDMTYRDAKDYCLPRRRYKNNLWHAFSFRLTDCLDGEDALSAYGGGFEGECCLLCCDSGDSGEMYFIPAELITKSMLDGIGSAVVFTKDLTRTYAVTGIENTGPYYKEV